MGSFADFFVPLTTEEVETSINGFLEGLGLTPSDWDPGDPEAAIVWSVSATTATLWNKFGAPAIAAGFLDYATGKGLQARAKQGYGVDYIPASFASGEWTGTNSSGAALGPYAPGDLLFADDTTGKTYRNTEEVTFLPATPLPILIEANEAGTASNAAPGAIVLHTVIAGLSGSNALAVLGRDDEKETALKNRCRKKLGSLSPNGPRSAYEFVALTPTDPNGRWDHGVAVTKVKVSKYSETATVDVLLAGPSGEIAGDLVTEDSDLYLVNDAIQTAVVPDGVTCTVASAAAHVVAPTYTIYVPASLGLSEAEVKALVDAALAALFADPDIMPIGGAILPTDPSTGYVFKNVIEATILKAVAGALQVTVAAPSADEALLATETPVLGTITGTVVFT